MTLMLPTQAFTHILHNEATRHGYRSYVGIDTTTYDAPRNYTDIDLDDTDSEFRLDYLDDNEFNDDLFEDFNEDADPVDHDPFDNPTDFAALEHPANTGKPTTYHQVIINLEPLIEDDIAISLGLLLRSDIPAADKETDVDDTAELTPDWLDNINNNPYFFIDSLLCEIRNEGDSSTLSPEQRSAQAQSLAYQSQILTTHYADALLTLKNKDSFSAFDISSIIFDTLPNVE